MCWSKLYLLPCSVVSYSHFSEILFTFEFDKKMLPTFDNFFEYLKHLKVSVIGNQFGALSRRQWASVVVDEAHTKLRAAETDSDETACLLELLSNIPFRLLLTGTPCTSRLADMYHPLSLVTHPLPPAVPEP